NAYKDGLNNSACAESAKETQLEELKTYTQAMKRIMQGVPADAKASLYLQARTSAGNMEKALSSVFVPQVQSLILSVRRHEKDYLLRGSEKYIKKTLSSLENLEAAFVSSSILEKDRVEIEKESKVIALPLWPLDMAAERMGQRTVALEVEAGVFSKTAMGIGGAALFIGIVISLL
ncbi:methyl-accepting chemotaxis protein, partial [Aduncisulcus paluster]